MSKDLEAICYVMERLEIEYYELDDHLKEKEDKWDQKMKEYEYQLQLFQEEYSNDNEIINLKEVEVNCNQKNRIPYIIENMPPSIMKAILDQKTTDKSISSNDSTNDMSDSVSLTMSEREILYARQENKIQKKVFKDIEIISFLDDSSYY